MPIARLRRRVVVEGKQGKFGELTSDDRLKLIVEF